MYGDSRGAAARVALCAAVPTFSIITLAIGQLFVLVNDGRPVLPDQIFLALFTGLSFGLAVFAFIYSARRQGLR